jgi:ArsR family transcriptional regulator, arsenate/arsenite/antimonite-responsive transcriptional repressor
MQSQQIVRALRALAHAHRLALYRLLVERGPQGLPAGEISAKIGVAPSSLSFHLRALLAARLLRQRRASRQLIYSADYAIMNQVLGYLSSNCCAQADAPWRAPCVPAAAGSAGGRKRGPRS